MIELIVSNFGSVVSGIGAIIVVLIGAFFKGKSTGAKREQAERAAELNKQAVDAWKKLNEVENDIKQKNDDAVANELKSKWVRK